MTYCGITTGAISHRYAYFGRGSGPVFMTNVHCSGSETHLVNCSHSTLPSQYCSHYYDVGVECPGELFSKSISINLVMIKF